MLKLLLFFDLFAQEYHFPLKKHNKFRTTLGGIVSLCIAFFVLTVFAMFIKDLILNNNVNLFYKEVLSSNYQMDVNHLPFAIGIDDINGTSLNYEKYVTISFLYMERKNYNNIFRLSNIPFKTCKFKDFNNNIYIPNFLLESNSTLHCFDSNNITTYSTYSFPNDSFIRISVTPCNTNNSNCASLSEIHTFLHNNQITFSLYYVESNLDFSLFGKPISKYLKKKSIILQAEKMKRYDYIFQEIEIVTTSGFLFRKDNVDSTLRLIETYTEYNEIEVNNIIELNFFHMEKKLIYFRSYIDIIYIFSYIGGLYTFLNGLVSWLFKAIYVIKMKETLIQSMYNITLLDNTLNTNFQIGTLQNKINFQKKETLSKGSQGNLRNLNIRNLDNKLNLNTSNLFLLNQNMILNQAQNIPREIRGTEDSNYKNNEVIDKILTSHAKSISPEEKKISHGNKSFFTYYDIIKLVFKCNRGSTLINKEKLFKSLLKFNLKFVDSVNIARSLSDLEKLKSVIFDEKQLALFNLLSKPKVPSFGDKKKTSIINNEIVAENYLHELKLKNKLNFVEKRLLELS